MAMKPLAVTAYTMSNALGRGIAASLAALRYVSVSRFQ